MKNYFNSWVRLVPFGGADTVTGACYLLTVVVAGKERHYLVDCGLYSRKNSRKMNTNICSMIDKISAVFVTHAHIDHTGRLPLLYKYGYRGPVYATEPVKALSKIMLPDSARIQEYDYIHTIKRLGITSKELVKATGMEPLYTVRDAVECLDLFVPVERGNEIKVDDYISVCFYNAGHGIGSSSIMVTIDNGMETFRIYFSGDLGQNNAILKQRRDTFKEDVDFVVMESTYADRIHRERKESWKELRELVANTILKGGNVILPVFAVGRTQEMLYLYYEDMMENNDWVADVFRRTPVYIDSCMACQATEQFKKFPEEFKAPVAKQLREKGNNLFYFPQLTIVQDAADSKKFTQQNNNYIVFSAAGMCNAGRVLYHLEKDIGNPNSAVIFTGFQAEGTLGRRIIDGDKIVRIHGEEHYVQAKIASINAFSAHVDQEGLVKWLSKIEKGYTLFLAHGEPLPQNKLRTKLIEEGIVEEEKVDLLACGKMYYLRKDGYDISTFSFKVDERGIQSADNHGNRKTTLMIEKIRDAIVDALEDMWSPELLRMIDELESEMKRIKSRVRKQTKPNKSRMIRK